MVRNRPDASRAQLTSSTRPSAAGSALIRGPRSSTEFERAEAAVAPVYTAQDIAEDPHFQALGTIRRVADDDLGELAMQGPLFRMTDGDAPTRFAGRSPGVDTTTVLRELGYDDDHIAALVAEGAAGVPEAWP